MQTHAVVPGNSQMTTTAPCSPRVPRHVISAVPRRCPAFGWGEDCVSGEFESVPLLRWLLLLLHFHCACNGYRGPRSTMLGGGRGESRTFPVNARDRDTPRFLHDPLARQQLPGRTFSSSKGKSVRNSVMSIRAAEPRRGGAARGGSSLKPSPPSPRARGSLSASLLPSRRRSVAPRACFQLRTS